MKAATAAASRLALLGGAPAIAAPLIRYNTIGAEEAAAAHAVVASGVLSGYLGSWSEEFYGGAKVREFERAWAEAFGSGAAVAVNSLTSGLIAALGAAGVAPGDEVIVSPWTMAASATAPLHWNAIPVFADVEPEYFCLDPGAVEAAVTPRTRAIVAVDIFGQSADVAALRAIARRHGLTLISDTAQAPGATIDGRRAGTQADIGGFSLNYHKPIHTGEGGVMVTDDARLAERMQLIRNHAEVVVGDMEGRDLRNMLGFNFRLGEMEAAIGLEQLRKLDGIVTRRQRMAARLCAHLEGLEGLQTPAVRPRATHVYSCFAFTLDGDGLGVTRERIVAALEAEGVPGLRCGYTNVHRLPIFRERIAFGTPGFPWNAPFCSREVSYPAGLCPVAERLHERTCFLFVSCHYELPDADVDRIADAFHKVWAHLDDLRGEPTA